MGKIEGILGLKFSIPGYFWVGKFGKYIFLGWLGLVGFWGVFKTIQRFVVVPAYPDRVVMRLNKVQPNLF